MSRDAEQVPGIWWRPEDQENAIAGILTLSGDRPELDLIGAWHDLQSIGRTNPVPVIHGIGAQRNITLVAALPIRDSLSVPGLHTVGYSCGAAFFGGHLPAAHTFTQFRFGFDALTHWVATSGFSSTFHANPETHYFEGYQLSFASPPTPELRTPTATYTIRTYFQRQGEGFYHHELRESHIIDVVAQAPCTLDAIYERHIYPWRTFLTLLSDHPARPTLLQVGLRREQESQVTWVDTHVPWPTTPTESTVPHSRDMVLNLRQLGDSLEGAFCAWLDNLDNLEPVYTQFFATEFQSSLYTEASFLFLVHAAETLHRRGDDARLLSDGEWQLLHTTLTQVVRSATAPGSLRDVLTGKLRYLNELSLRQRLRALIEPIRELLAPLFAPDGLFIDQVVNTRNYLTHFDETIKAQACHGLTLYTLNLKLRAVLQLSLLSSLGLGEELLRTALSSQPFLRLRQRLALAGAT